MIQLGIADGPAREIRADDATDLYFNALDAIVSGDVSTWAAAAVETAAGLWGRALSTAKVPAGVPAGPRLLNEMGRDLAIKGEAVYLLDVDFDGRLRLRRARSTDVWGDDEPSTWHYRLTLQGPRTTRTVVAPAGRVVHVRYATEAHSPQRGIPPIQYAHLTGKLIRNLETAIGDEAGGTVANLIALPAGHSNPTKLAARISEAKGKTLLPETTAGGWDMGKDAAPRKDFVPARLGANPPAALVALRQHVESSILGCFGIAAPLGPEGRTDGTAAREAARRLWSLTVQPLADLIAEELSRVLERPVRLDHSQPAGTADIAARARAVHVLVESGIDKDRAMQIVGWE